MLAGAMLVCALALRADDTAAPATTPEPSYHASIVALFGKDVVAVDKSKIATAPDLVKKKKYLFIYQGANWCPPCRAFSPTLVAFYNHFYASNGDFELIFVSLDKSQSEMDTYMKREKMPWAGLKPGSKGAKALQSKYKGSGIPSLTLIDENDKVLAHSFDAKGKYLGPRVALEVYMQLHGMKPAPASMRKAMTKGTGKKS